MDENTAAFEELIQRFILWANQDQNIRGAVVIGSRARQDHPADKWSDLDLLFFARDPKRYLDDADWLENMGSVWISFIEPTADGRGFERRVLYEGGLDVDFVPSPVETLETLLSREIPADIADLLLRGIRIVLDKDGTLEALAELEISVPPYIPPAVSDYLNLVNDFWYHSVWTAKHLRRGELWWAKSGCDSYLKNLLRQMLEWHAHALSGDGVDTWMRGRFLEEWADPRAVLSLPQIFAHYDEEDVWRALLATMDLFGWLAKETGDHVGYQYPESSETHARELVAGMYAAR